MKIAIVVHGRFHAFHLAREMIKQGEDILVLTNYPYFAVKPFGIPRKNYKGSVWHGLMARILHRIGAIFGRTFFESWIHRSFSLWASRVLRKSDWDVVHAFTGVAEEVFDGLGATKTVKNLVRGSAHIAVQLDILASEEKRAGKKIDKPSSWMVEREKREYAKADGIVILSSFAKDSFISQGVAAQKLFLLPLGVDTARFRSPPQKIQERCQRILSGDKLRVLMTGNFSYQKGALDFKEIVSNLRAKTIFRFVGTVLPETAHLAKSLAAEVEWVSRQNEFSLPSFYDWADIFIFTSLQDGFAAVLSQARAAGLPILSTMNCSAPDFIKNDVNGWILPIRDPNSFVNRLNWCDSHRAEMAEIVRKSYDLFCPRDWRDVAHDLTVHFNRLKIMRQLG